METININVRLYDAVAVFDIIEEVLRKNRNTQVFIDSNIYAELLYNGKKYNVREVYLSSGTTYHYAENVIKGLKYFLNDENRTIKNVASFVYNSFNYVQLVEFSSKNFKTYVHSCEKFEQLLLINEEK